MYPMQGRGSSIPGWGSKVGEIRSCIPWGIAKKKKVSEKTTHRMGLFANHTSDRGPKSRIYKKHL